ncbi:MAG: TetR/AcrR family transcriptional regulator [Pseudomonadaceae bacterium]|nr:MAG: TetR/AcrR family transcriptional regulator [Pseudomonadaceae bacterium]
MSKSTSVRENARQTILEAALKIAGEQGSRAVTLDAVANACGLSKGGVMYHFKSKDALIEGMIGHLLEDRHTRLDRIQAEQPELGPLGTLIACREQQREDVSLGTAQALLTAATDNPALLEPVREHYRQLLDTMGASNDMQTLLVWLAHDGMCLQELLDISPFSENQLREIHLFLQAQANQIESNK